jgi:hypothetical protein
MPSALRRDAQRRLDEVERWLQEQLELRGAGPGGDAAPGAEVLLAHATLRELQVDLARIPAGAPEGSIRSLEIQLDWCEEVVERLGAAGAPDPGRR